MRTLLADIVAGTPAPGGAALREADIATRFGVSRGVARECVRGLEERGLVSVKPGRGATVNPPDRWAVLDPEVVGALLDADRGPEILAEYLECRRLLEVEAAALAATRADDDDLAALTGALGRMTAAAQRAALSPAAEDVCHDADLAFHRALIAATRNAALGTMLGPLWRALDTARRGPSGPGALERSVAAHRRILAAVAGRDPAEARAAMADHLAGVEADLRANPPDPDLPHVDEHRAA